VHICIVFLGFPVVHDETANFLYFLYFLCFLYFLYFSGSHKRTLSSLLSTLRADGHDVDALWESIGQLCVKTVISVQPHLEHTYFSARQPSDDAGFGCFEVSQYSQISQYSQ
jgi:hypothetical protein